MGNYCCVCGAKLMSLTESVQKAYLRARSRICRKAETYMNGRLVCGPQDLRDVAWSVAELRVARGYIPRGIGATEDSFRLIQETEDFAATLLSDLQAVIRTAINE